MLVTLIFFLVIQHIIQVPPKCGSSTGLVRKEGRCSFLKNCHHITIAPSFLSLYFSSDLLRELPKIVLHITDLIFHQVYSAVNISWDIVTILSPFGSLVNLSHLIHLSLYIFHQGICSSQLPLLMTFCSIFIKTTLYLHSHVDPHKIPKFSSGSKENTFQRSSHPLNFKQCYHSIIQQFFSRGPRPFLEEEYIKKHTRIFTKYFLCVFLSQALQRKLPATRWSRETGNVFLHSPGGNSARAEDRAVSTTATGPAEQRGRVAGSAGANRSGEGRGDPCCLFSGLDLHGQFPRDHFIFHVGPAFFLSLRFLCLLKQRPTAEGEPRSYSAEGS